MALEDYIRRAQQLAGQPINLGMPNQAFLDYWYQQGLQRRQQEEQQKEEEKRQKELQKMQEQLALDGADQATIQKITDSILQGSKSPTDEQLQQMKKVVDARARLKAAGQDPNKPIDDRNALEKWLNLPKGQNWFWDTLDILGRPLQAVEGFMKAGQDNAKELQKFDPQAFSVYMNQNGSPQAERWKEQNPERWQRFMNEVQKLDSRHWDYALAGLKGTKQYSMPEMLAEGHGRKTPNAWDYIVGVPAEIATDPLNIIGSGLIKNTVKGAANLLGQADNLEKGVNAARNAVDSLKAKALNSNIGQALDNIFGTEGRRLDLQGNLTNDLIDAEREMKAFRSYYKEKALNDVVGAINTAGDIGKGEDVAKIMEQGNVKERIDALDQELQDLQSSLSSTQADKAQVQQIQALMDKIKALKSSPEYYEASKTIGAQLKNTQINNKIQSIYDKADGRPLSLLETERVNQLSKKLTPTEDILNAKAKKAVIDDYINTLQKQVDQFKAQVGGRIGTQLNKLTRQEQKTLDQINAIKDSGKREALVNRFNQVEQLKQDPALSQAADQLMNSNQELRQLAQEAGIHIDDLKGYMAHVLTDEAEKALSDETIRKLYPAVGGNKKVLERTLNGTVDEINAVMKKAMPELGGANLFEPNAFFATAKGQQRLVNFIALEAFKKKVLTNPKLAIKVENAVAKPKNAVKIRVSDFVMGDSKTKEILGRMGADAGGGEYYVTKGVANAFKNFVRLANDQDTLVNFFKGYDKVLRGWKKLALLNPSYHINNVAGSLMSQYIRGMNMADIAHYNLEAAKIIKDAANGKISKVYDEFLRQGLNQSGHYGEDFVRKEEQDLMKELLYRTKSKKEKALYYLNPLNLSEGSRRLGDNADNLTRFATYLWAKDAGKSAKEAANIVRETHFDYTELTKTEREAFRRLVPFYTFTRKTIPFLFKYAAQNPTALSHINTILNEAYSATGQRKDIVPDYLRNALALPISASKMLSVNPPLTTLTQLGGVQDLAKMFQGMLSPVLKVPLDIAYNKDFQGKPIDNPALYALEQLIPPLNRADKAIQDVKDNKGLGAAISDLVGFNNIKNYDENKFVTQKYREMAQKYADSISQLKKQGVDIPTITDLRKAGIVSGGQASEKQVDEAKAFADLAKKNGITDKESIQLLLKLKRNIERKDADNADKWREYLLGRGLPQELVDAITSKYVDVKVPDKLAN